MDILKNVFSVSGVQIIGQQSQSIDFSHKISKFQIGDSVDTLLSYQKWYPDLVSVNSLNGVDYQSKNPQDGHSLFLYEINALRVQFPMHHEYNFNYNKNTINTLL